jgi:radical SAM superfamily enzyme YgiQ (UPF0313 family)
MTISAVLKQAGHTVDVFIDTQTNEKRFLDELAEYGPDIVGFAILSPSVPWALQMGRRVKETLGAITVYGNVHAILSPDIIENPGVDMVCIGEGEYPMLDLCNAVDAGQDYCWIEGFWVKTPEGIVKNPMRRDLVDLDALPFHDRTIYDKYAFFRRSHYLRVMAGRGCPYRCSFCANPALTDLFGGRRYIRKRTPALVIEEIRHTIKNHPAKVKYIFFIDEVLWVRNDWLRELLALYKAHIGLPFFASFRFGAIREHDIRLLAEAGCKALSLAFESGDERQRRELMNKPVSDEHILEISTWMRRYHIGFCASAFFGLPGDTFEDHVRRLEFYRRVNPTYLWTTFFQPYPGVALARHPEIQKYLPQDKPFEATLHHDMYLDLPNRDWLIALNKVYFLCMKFPRLQSLLLWLTRYRIPFFLDFLFFLHFTYYVFTFERVSLFQWCVHLRIFALNPILRKRRPPQDFGTPFAALGGEKRLASSTDHPGNSSRNGAKKAASIDEKEVGFR